MKKTFSSKKSAFSLIELSIVLIIIGLLIAGITGGASLIKSSELRSIMSEARSYAVSVNSFFTQYDRYPGDSDIAVGGNSKNVGDRDNTIEYLANAGANTGVSEGLDAWNDLKDIGAIDLSLTLEQAQVGLATTGNGKSNIDSMVPVTNIPGSKIKGAGWAFDYADNQNVVVITGTTTGSKTGLVGVVIADRAAAGIITAGDSLSIDSKIDDGKANTGTVRGYEIETNKCIPTGNGNEAKYNVASGSAKNCILAFRVDVSS
jgi:prepilin-type N-terminal cleavage/methylation domain-containing protein